ncbi:MAG: metal-binding protein [Pyrinomonadaceae bacterium]
MAFEIGKGKMVSPDGISLAGVRTMPSGRTHDAITFLLAVPAFVVTYSVTGKLSAAAIVGAAFVFGGLMFGPDLDTVSRQYSRWSVLRLMWYPYRSFFKHRSRFSHGLVFGALLRVIYFMGVLTLVALVAGFAWSVITSSRAIGIASMQQAWSEGGNLTRRYLGENFLLLTFVGLWLGAASHTFTDMAGSFIKTGRIAKFL